MIVRVFVIIIVVVVVVVVISRFTIRGACRRNLGYAHRYTEIIANVRRTV